MHQLVALAFISNPDPLNNTVVHHKNNDKSFSVSNGIAQGKGLETIKKEIEKCIVVCSRCHAEIHSSK